MCYFVKYVNHEFIENDEHLLLQGEMFNCPRVLHDWKYQDANPKPKYYGAVSLNKDDTNEVGEFWKFTEGHETILVGSKELLSTNLRTNQNSFNRF
jgi:hypothetical protein